ncbi:hypothetical protein [Moumouvirus maliensis]|nr:hypothetical protein [Moumouvirus maliensis]
MSELYQVFYENKNKITPVSTHEYCTNLQSAIDLLIKTIRNYKNGRGKKFYDPIDMNCDYNIYIYKVEVWKNISTGVYKFDTINKVFPKAKEISKELDIYIRLYDKPDMNVAKLCLEMYGQNITYEEIKTVRKNYIENIINTINEKLNKNEDDGIVFEINISGSGNYNYGGFSHQNKNLVRINIIESKKCDNDGNKLIGFNYIVLRYLDYYYGNKGYIFKYTTNNNHTIFLFNKKFIDQIMEEFNGILLEANILNISYTDPEYKLKRDKKLYLFKNFIKQKDIADVAKDFLSDKIESECSGCHCGIYYYKKFEDVDHYEPKKIEGKTFEDYYNNPDYTSDTSDQEDESDNYSD